MKLVSKILSHDSLRKARFLDPLDVGVNLECRTELEFHSAQDVRSREKQQGLAIYLLQN